MRVKHRTFLRTKEQRLLREELMATPQLLHRALIGTVAGKVPVEHIILKNHTELYLIKGQPWLVRQSDLLFPALHAVLDKAVGLPEIVVDMGAVPHIANGADVMAPGIVEMSNSLIEGDLVAIIDKKNRTPLAVGQMLKTTAEIQKMDKGRVIQTLHHVGDRLWKLMKTISE